MTLDEDVSINCESQSSHHSWLGLPDFNFSREMVKLLTGNPPRV